jgi:hypothetical protein
MVPKIWTLAPRTAVRVSYIVWWNLNYPREIDAAAQKKEAQQRIEEIFQFAARHNSKYGTGGNKD